MSTCAALNCFNAGELSPRMLGRPDVSQYGKGCETLKNFLVTPYGAVERRPGTRFLIQAKYPDRPVRICRFVYSADIAYLLEFGDHYLRFLRDGSPVAADGGGVLELATPYATGELARLQFVQSADVMTIVHPGHPVQELKRTAANVFTLTEKEFEFPPVLDPNLDDDLTVTPSGESMSVGAAVTLTASKALFESGHAGAYFQVIHTRRENEISIDFKADGTSSPLEVFGFWTFTTHGTWTGTLTIQRSFDNGGTWSDFRTYSSAKDSNTSDSGEEEAEDVLYRLSMSGYEASSTGTLKLCRCLLVNPDFQITGVVKLTSVTSATVAAGTVIRKLGGTTATAEWNEGAWSEKRGYPCAVSYYEERMMLGGTAANPNRIWGSRTGDWDNFRTGDKDDDGLDFTLCSDTVNSICWMCQHDALVIGTMDSEWTLSASGSEQALTPSNFRVKRQSVYGSSAIAAQMVGDVILFVQRQGRKVREFVYTFEKDGYSSPDMTILADHVTGSGIREIALQQLPDSILWCVLGNGTLAALTYERDQEVVGWHRHDTGGRVISCCVLPEGDEDRVYFAVERNGAVLIESMASRKTAFHVDSGVELSSDTAFDAVSGLDHLNGLSVQVLADGAVQMPVVVENGSIALSEPARHAIIGIGYDSVLSPMPIEVELQNGHTLMRRKIIGELRIRVYDSVGGEARSGGDQWQKIIARDVLGDTMDAAIAARSDVVRLAMQGGYEDATMIEVRQCDPLPLNITAIMAIYEVAE